MDADDDRAVMALRKRLWYKDVCGDRMTVDHAIYLSQNVKFLLNRGAGHSTAVNISVKRGCGRGRGARERVNRKRASH